jgi:hypothetical protein
MLRRSSPFLPVFSLSVLAARSVLVWWALPAKRGPLLFPAGLLVFSILLMEAHWRAFPNRGGEGQRVLLRSFFAGLALILLASVAIKVAAADLRGAGWLAPAVRAKGVLAGVTIAAFGNFLPKLISPWPRGDEAFDWQGVHRFVGWILVLTGIAITVAWLALPIVEAARATMVLTLLACVLCLGRKIHSLATWDGHRGVS